MNIERLMNLLNAQEEYLVSVYVCSHEYILLIKHHIQMQSLRNSTP